MNEEIKVKHVWYKECFKKYSLFGSRERELSMNYEFRFETENNPIWGNTPDHYFEMITVKFANEEIVRLYNEDIDELIKFVDKIKEVREKYKYVIKNKNFYKKKTNTT